MIDSLVLSIRQKQNLLIHLALPVIILVGAGFRFYKIGSQSVWLDEAFSIWMGSHAIPDIIRLTIDIDQHPPLYPILLHFWMLIGGDNEAWTRSLSALFGILTIPVIYSLAKTLSGSQVGLLSALFLAAAPFHIQYAQEARAYALLALCASISLWMTARILVDSRTHTQPIGQQEFRLLKRQERRSRFDTDLSWAGYMLFTALAVFTHNTAIFLPIGINLFVLGLMLYRRYFPAKDGQLQPPSLRNWLAAQVGVFLLWSPWLPFFYTQTMGMADAFWLQPPTVKVVQEALKTFLMGYLPEFIGWRWLIWVGFAGALIVAWMKFRAQAGHFVFLAVLFLTPFLGELLVSLRQPIFYDRTLIWATIPLYILTAAGIIHLRHKSYIFTAVAIITTISLLSIGNFFDKYEKERWDLAAEYVHNGVREGDIIVFNAGWTQIPFDYYFRQYHFAVEEYGVPQTMFENGELEPRMEAQDIPRLRAILRGRSRVWLVYSHNWWTDPEELVPAELNRELRMIEVKNFTGMQIQLYER